MCLSFFLMITTRYGRRALVYSSQKSGVHPTATLALTHHKDMNMLMAYTDSDMITRFIYIALFSFMTLFQGSCFQKSSGSCCWFWHCSSCCFFTFNFVLKSYCFFASNFDPEFWIFILQRSVLTWSQKWYIYIFSLICLVYVIFHVGLPSKQAK